MRSVARRNAGRPRQTDRRAYGTHAEALEPRRLLAVSATLFANDVAVGSEGGWFHVAYRSEAGINVSSIDSSDLRVTGPGGFSEPVQFVDLTKPDTSTNPTAVVARYRIAPPTPTWRIGEVGTYTVTVRADQVRDAGGAALASGSIGRFDVTSEWRLPASADIFSPVNTFVLGADGTGAGIDNNGWVWHWDGTEFVGPLDEGLETMSGGGDGRLYFSRDIQVDGSGRIHVAFQVTNSKEIRHAVYDPGSGIWSATAVGMLPADRHVLTVGQHDGLHLRLGTDGTPHVFWATVPSDPFNADRSDVRVFHAGRHGGTWTVAAVPLAARPALDNGTFMGMSAVLDRQDTPWIAFIAHDSRQVTVAHRAAAGWVTESLPTNGALPIIAAAPTGDIGVTYLLPSTHAWANEGMGIGFAGRSDGGWTIGVVASSPTAGAAQLAVTYGAPRGLVFDAEGHPHIHYFAGGTAIVARRVSDEWRATALGAALGSLATTPSGRDVVIAAGNQIHRRSGPSPLGVGVALMDVSSDHTDVGSHAHRFTVRYSSLTGIDRSSIDPPEASGDIEVTGPGGFRQLATLRWVISQSRDTWDTAGIETTWVATYQITSPGPAWTAADAGTYSIRLRDGEITSATGETFAGVDVGTFTVDVTKKTSAVRDSAGQLIRAAGNVAAGLAFGPDGLPRLATVTDGWGDGRGDVRVSRWTGSDWDHAILAQERRYFGKIDLAVDGAGRSVLAYKTPSMRDLTVRRWDGGGQEVWTFPDGSAAYSLVVDREGQPALAYVDETNAYLKIARFDGAAWRVSRIDLDGVVSDYGSTRPSLAFDRDGNPHIAYVAALGHPSHDRELRYATWDGEEWQISVVQRRDNENWRPGAALALNSNGAPAIAVAAGHEVRLFTPTDGGWTSEPVTRGGSPAGLVFDTEDRPNLLVNTTHRSPTNSDGTTWSSAVLMVRDADGWRGETLKQAFHPSEVGRGSFNYSSLQGTRLAVTPAGRPVAVLQVTNDDYSNGPFWLAGEPSSLPGGSPRPPVDLDGSGIGDVVWVNEQGVAEAWLDGDAGRVRPLGGGGGWSLAATADFNDDGVGDLVWRDGNGGFSAWLMAADGRATTTGFLGGGGGWALEATGDYDGDGRTDLMWRHAPSGVNVQWLMNGLSVAAATVLGGTADWRLVPTDERFDADGDGRTDVVWRHRVSGVNVLHRLNGGTVVSARALGGDAAWRIAGTGDFDGDGQSDVLWRAEASGVVVMHVMSDGAVRESGFIGGDPTWSVAGSEVGGGTRRSRILWRHAGGTVVRQGMNGRVVESSETIRSSAVWRLLGRPGDAVA